MAVFANFPSVFAKNHLATLLVIHLAVFFFLPKLFSLLSSPDKNCIVTIHTRLGQVTYMRYIEKNFSIENMQLFTQCYNVANSLILYRYLK